MRFIIPILFLSLLLASCEKSVTINLPEQPKKLVLNAVVHEGDSIRGYLTRSLSNAESGKNINPSVQGAQALLYKDGVLVDTLSNTGFGEYESKIKAEAGHHYRLVISHPDYPTMDAETDAPAHVPIISWEAKIYGPANPKYGENDFLKIIFNDPSTTDDRYIFQILAPYDEQDGFDFYTWGSCLEIKDPSVESPYTAEFPGEDVCYPSRSVFLKDALFNGKKKELSMYLPNSFTYSYLDPQTGDTLFSVVRLFHVTPEFYQFVKSYRGSQDASDNPFAEPFNVMWTVKGGYGVFTILSEERFELEW
jgi:hypothetical protein